MPVLDGASGIEHERELRIRLFGERFPRHWNEPGTAVFGLEAAVGIETTRRTRIRRALGKRPLDAAVLLDRLVRHTRVVAEAARRDPPPFVEGILGNPPARKQLLLHVEHLGHGKKDVEVRSRLGRRIDGAVHLADPALRVRIGAVLLAPHRRREHEVGELGGRRRVKRVLDDEEFEILEGLLERAQVRKGDDRVGRDDPERSDASIERGLDDVGIGEPPGGWNPFDGHVPQGGEGLAILPALELAIAGQAGRESGFARAHRVALSRNRKRRGAGPADVARDEREVVDGVDRLGSLRAVIHAHRPTDEPRPRPGVEPRGAVDRLGREPGDVSHAIERVLADRLPHRLEAGGVLLDVAAVDQVVLDHDVDQSVDEREIGTWPDGQVQVGHHRGLGDARIDHDERGVPVGLEAMAEDRMVVRDVGAYEDDHVGAVEILVGAGRAIAAERAFVPGHRRRHAQRRVAVVVRGAEPELHEFSERVELFGDELPGADHADGACAVPLLDVPERRRHGRQRVVPGNPGESSVAFEQRIPGATGGIERVVLRQALRAQPAAVYRMTGVAAHAHRPAVLDAHEHPAADGAVPAGCGDPAVGHLLRRDVAGHRIDGVRVPIGACVEAQDSLQIHAASTSTAR